MNYSDYVDQYNMGDYAALVHKFYTDDIVFESGAMERVCQGQDEVIEFLTSMQSGIREFIRPQVVLQDKNHIFAESDMDFYALKDLPEFPLGALRRDKHLTVKVFVIYYLREEKICRIKTALWPANFGVTDPPARGF